VGRQGSGRLGKAGRVGCVQAGLGRDRLGKAGRLSQGMNRNGTSSRGQVRLGRYVGSR
jgi:hypothetical protein